MTSLTKNPQPPSKKFFFEWRLEDLPSLLSLWTALYRFRHQSYAHTNPRAICFFFVVQNRWNLPNARVNLWAQLDEKFISKQEHVYQSKIM